MFIFDLTFQLRQQQQRETESNLNKDQITFLTEVLLFYAKKGELGRKELH